MPVKDIASDLEATKNADLTIAAAGTEVGNGVDTADFGEGVMFAGNCTAYTAGNHVLGAEESDDDGATDPYTTVPAEKIIGAGTIDAVTADGDVMQKIGVFSTKRWVRPAIVSDAGTASVTVVTVKKGELLPV